MAFISLGFFCFILPRKGYPVPAAPIIHTLSQPDGMTFKARQWGDENIHGWETEEGYSILFDEGLGSWTYAVHAPDGSLTSSGILVGKDKPPATLKKLRPEGEALCYVPFKSHSKELKTFQPPLEEGMSFTDTPESVVPPIGTANVPVILINFNNTATTYTAQSFNTLLFGTGNYSMKDYYQEVSYGAFSVSPGPDGVVGWYTASNTHDYYGRDYGGISGSDDWPGDLVYEAVAAADAAGFNFAPYDEDGDCYVDVVMIVHQGTGQEASGISTDIWSHRWSLAGAYYWGYSHYGIYTTDDPCPKGGYIKVNDYTIQPEIYRGQISTVGVFAHEYGHSLGLPDLYDTDFSSEGIGNWSLMAGGSWNYLSRFGDRPAHLDPWSKYKLGWVRPTEVVGTLPNEPVDQAATNADVYKLLSGTPYSGEYFLVENRQRTGFDAGLPGAGLLIWHIDALQTTNDNECYPTGPSCAIQHYKVALVQADNRWDLEKNSNQGDAGDPYPGSTSNTSFTRTSSPNSNLYNGAVSNVTITNISTSSPRMTATLSTDTAYTLTVTKIREGNAYGTITAIGCQLTWSGNTGTCTASYGTQITLSAEADQGSTWVGWSGGTGSAASCTGTDPCAFTFTEDSGVTATFDLATAMKLLTPNGGEVIPSGSTYTIRWEAPSSMTKFGLWYSLNGGRTWKTILPKGQFLSGTSYDWTVPMPSKNTSKCLVKVVGLNDAGKKLGEDRSDGVFTIEVVRLTSPNGGETLSSNVPYDIAWVTNATVRPVANVVLSYTLDGKKWKRITTITGSNPGSYTWMPPVVSAPLTKCMGKLILKDSGGKSVGKDVSDGYFTITP